MTRVVIDQPIRQKLLGLEQRLELCDESGRVLGYFTPATANGGSPRIECPFSEEEMRQLSQQEGGRPLEDIIRDLERRA